MLISYSCKNPHTHTLSKPMRVHWLHIRWNRTPHIIQRAHVGINQFAIIRPQFSDSMRLFSWVAEPKTTLCQRTLFPAGVCLGVCVDRKFRQQRVRYPDKKWIEGYGYGVVDWWEWTYFDRLTDNGIIYRAHCIWKFLLEHLAVFGLMGHETGSCVQIKLVIIDYFGVKVGYAA